MTYTAEIQYSLEDLGCKLETFLFIHFNYSCTNGSEIKL